MKLTEIEALAKKTQDHRASDWDDLAEQTLKLCQLVRDFNKETLRMTGFTITAGHGIEIDEEKKS